MRYYYKDKNGNKYSFKTEQKNSDLELISENDFFALEYTI